MIIPRPEVAWFTNEARILRAKVRKREKIWRKSSSSFAFDDLKLARSAYRKQLKDSKMSHFREAIALAKGDSHRLFNIADGLMGKQRINPLPPGDPDDLAEQFANFFAINGTKYWCYLTCM